MMKLVKTLLYIGAAVSLVFLGYLIAWAQILASVGH